MKKIVIWFKSHVLISTIFSIVLIIGIMLIPTVIIKVNHKIEYKTNIELNDVLCFEVNSDLYLMSLIKKISNGELITENYKIDTSRLGTQEIVIKYFNEKQEEKNYSFNIDIIDTTPPIIEYSKELSTTFGNKIDLSKDVKVIDNSNEEINITIEGEYDFNMIGTYNLKYIAIDNSGNKTIEEFILRVNNIDIKTNGYYIATSGSNGYASVKFYDGNRFNWWSDLGGYGEAYPVYDGTYKIERDIITFIIEKEYLTYDGWVESDGSFTATLINKNTFKTSGNYIYNWQSTSKFSTKHP